MSDMKRGDEDTAVVDAAHTTMFVEDGNTASHSMDKQETLDDFSIRDQSIVDFMAKPQLISNASWTESSAQGASLVNFSIASQLYTNPYWANKIQGFNLVRGTAVVRLQINANPFQSGKLFLAFLPLAPEMVTLDPSYAAMKLFNIATIRQLPGVELDVRESSAILKIPYITPFSYLDVKRGGFDWGNVYLVVLTPLRTGSSGENNIEYSIYLSFEDFELAAPSVPQGPNGRRFKSKTFKRNPTEEEVEKVGDETVSSTLSKVSTIAGMASKIPLIGPVAGSISWASNVASKVAGALGWAKPNLEDGPTYVSRQFNHYFPNVDGADVSANMALSATNRVRTVTAAAPTNDDEMSWDYLKRVSTPINTISWTTSQAVGTSLLSRSVSPYGVGRVDTVTKTAATLSYATGSPTFFMSNFFKLWRGSMRLVLKVAKTDYHTGRLMVTFTPYKQPGTAPVYNGNAQLSLRHIVDLREGAEICLECPYYHGETYLDKANFSGQLDITVLNVLRCPETASATIDILEYWCGGDDLELAVPLMYNDVFNNHGTLPFYPQIGELVCDGIGGAKIPSENTLPAELCIGEKFLSVKQLVSRLQRFWRSAPGGENGFSIFPWFRTIPSVDATTGAISQPYMFGDMFPILSQMYLYMRGSVRLAASGNGLQPYFAVNIPNRTGTAAVNYVVAQTPIIPGYQANLGSSILPANVAQHIQEPDVKQLNLQVPYYSNCHCTIMRNVVGPSDIRVTTDGDPGSIINITQSDATSMAMFRAFGDDFQMSYFLGAPVILLNYTAV